MKTDSGSVTLDNKTLKTITSETNGDTVKLIVKENAALTEAQQTASAAITENGKLFDLAAQIGNRLLHDFQGGKAYVTLPMPQKLKGKDVLVVYIDESGLCEALNHSVEKIGADEYISFTTTHFSTFAIAEKAEAEKLIAAQKRRSGQGAECKAQQYKVTTSRTSKKSVKVQVAAKSDKTLLTDIKNMGYTVKYQFYRSTKKDAGYKLRKTSSKNSFISTKGTKGRRSITTKPACWSMTEANLWLEVRSSSAAMAQGHGRNRRKTSKNRKAAYYGNHPFVRGFCYIFLL